MKEIEYQLLFDIWSDGCRRTDLSISTGLSGNRQRISFAGNLGGVTSTAVELGRGIFAPEAKKSSDWNEYYYLAVGAVRIVRKS